MNSTSQKKAAAMMPSRALLVDENLSQLTSVQQDAVLRALPPTGTRQVGVYGGIVDGQAVEVATLSIFDPS